MSIAWRPWREQVRSTGAKAFAVPCDVTEAAQVADAVDRAVERFGRVDVLVANAGRTPEGGIMPERVPDELFEQALRVK